jgi:predicted TIM-barrel fold metal-dependent hydrolase
MCIEQYLKISRISKVMIEMTENENNGKKIQSSKSSISKINLVLVILIIISLILLVYRFTLVPEKDEFEPKLPKKGIINIHEHFQTAKVADIWLDAMEQCGVSATVALGSPAATFFLGAEPGFNNYMVYNNLTLYLQEEYDSKFLAFPTIDPRDPGKLEYFKDQIASNALGLKLYSGHTGEIFPEPKTTLYDYLGPLNRSDMYEVYEYCEDNQIPIIWHIKLQWDYLFDETKAVLEDFPALIVNIPHFGVLGSDPARLGELMDQYPGVYTDISFGGFAYWSMQRVSDNLDNFKQFFEKYHDRVMFGTDIVITTNVRKTTEWYVNHTMAYRNMMEKDEFHVNISNITGEGFDFDMDLKGLGLSQDILDEIYYDTPIRFLKGQLAESNSSGGRGKFENNNYVYTKNIVSLELIQVFVLLNILILAVTRKYKISVIDIME